MSTPHKKFISDRLLERYNQDMLHGTGHILIGNRFDLSKMGTGAHSQAFGWGAYLAQARGTAESYRGYGLGKAKITITFNNGIVMTENMRDDWINGETLSMRHIFWEAQEQLVSQFYDLDTMKGDIRNGLLEKLSIAEDSEFDTEISDYEQAINLLDEIKTIKIDRRRGDIYEVDGPEDNVLLDWDADLSEQPEHVKRAIDKIKKSLAKYRGTYDFTELDNARRCRQDRKYMIVYKKFLLRVKKIYEIRTS